ncbi:hypothetical protein [Mariprofundus sp. KV]|nr:hypothetical protein [Mariprofundus sp. KV]
MGGLPIVGIGIVGLALLCGILVYVVVIAPKKLDQKQKMDEK